MLDTHSNFLLALRSLVLLEEYTVLFYFVFPRNKYVRIVAVRKAIIVIIQDTIHLQKVSKPEEY